MKPMIPAIFLPVLFLCIVLSGMAQGQTLISPASLDAHNVTLADVAYKGRAATRVIAATNAENGSSYAVVKGVSFQDGTIEVEVAGKPAANAGAAARGFIGMAFRLRNERYEYIYLRPTNGRADDQVRRNHATQYSSHPDYDFARLRRDAPEKYESYVDLEPGVWTKYKIEVEGKKARLYVHGSAQPCLIVDDLKMDVGAGAVALWVGPGTEGYFANLKITAKDGNSPNASPKIHFNQAHGEFPHRNRWPHYHSAQALRFSLSRSCFLQRVYRATACFTCARRTALLPPQKNKRSLNLSMRAAHFFSFWMKRSGGVHGEARTDGPRPASENGRSFDTGST